MRKFWSVLIIVAVLAVAQSAVSQPPAQQSATAKAPIKLAAILVFSGSLAAFGTDGRDGMEIFLDKLNGSGGVKGRHIQVDWMDYGLSQEQLNILFRRVAANPEYVGLLGPDSSTRLIALAPLIKQNTLPTIAISLTKWPGEFPDYLFRTNIITSAFLPQLLRDLQKSLKFRSMGLIYDSSNEYATDEGQKAEQVAKQMGIPIRWTVTFQKDDTDFSAQVAKAKSAVPDLIFIGGNYPEAGPLLLQLKQAGIDATKVNILAGQGVASTALGELSQGASKGVITIIPFNPSDDRPMVKDFLAKYRARRNKAPASQVVYGYDTALLMAEALKRAPDLKRENIRNALGQLKDIETLEGKYTFNGKGDNVNPSYNLGRFDEKGNMAVFKP